MSTTRANATTTVQTYQPVVYDAPVEGPALSRLHVEERFTGDIEASNVVEFLLSTTADGVASFVGFGRVDGELAGKRGTFLLRETGTIKGNTVSGECFVVLGSGTGELAGLRGTGGFLADLGQGATTHLDYSFE